MQKKYRYVAWLMLIPVLLIRGFTSLYPVVLSFRNSLYNMSLLNRGKEQFIGLQNFVNMLSDTSLQQSFGFTVKFTVVSMIMHLILGIGLALLMNVKFKGRKILRTFSLLPWAMPTIVAGQLARFAFNDTYGLINDLIRRIIPDFSYNWLVWSGSAQSAVIITDLWKDIPYFAILVLSALQYINNDLYEAARIDGANAIKSFWHITMPGISNTLMSLMIFFTLWRMTNFDIIYAMTGGGPGNSTSLIAYRIYTAAFSSLNLGYASAIGVVLFLAMAVVIVGLTYAKKRLNLEE
ncbi:MAG TPA: sugar ABC transporter permease [Candidatus Limiplasma sp.]|nr:sugar ABC transporter permease [Candidatus Limiplasma sp.]